METKLCPKCGKELNAEDIFCGFCGCDTTKVGLKQCPKCKEWIPLKYSFCPKCGWDTSKIYNPAPQTPPTPPRKKWKIWLPIAIIALIVGVFAIVKSCGDSQTFTVNGVSFKMIHVQGGTFTMGATSEQGNDADDDENPTHSVTLSDYYIAETEVTQELWEAVMGSNPSCFKGSNLPVEYVTWNECQEFIKKLNQLTGKNFRLPTEAEWEYAARGGNKSRGYKYAGSNYIDEVAWYDDNSANRTHPVKSKKPNELGLYDMSGNVWEWCQDWSGAYSREPQTNPYGPSSGSGRVLRGGSWFSFAGGCRVSYRFYYLPGLRFYYGGLRLAFLP